MPVIADWLGISTEGGVKVWRPRVILELVNQAFSIAEKNVKQQGSDPDLDSSIDIPSV